MELYLNQKKYKRLILAMIVLIIGLIIMACVLADLAKEKQIPARQLWFTIAAMPIYISVLVLRLSQLSKLKKDRPVIFIENGYLYDYTPLFFKIKGLDIHSIVSVGNAYGQKGITNYKLKLNENSLNRNLFSKLVNRKPKICDILVDKEELKAFIIHLESEISKSNAMLL